MTRLQRLLDIPADYQRVRLFHRESAEDWSDESGRLLLMGEAAHPLYVRRSELDDPIDFFMPLSAALRPTELQYATRGC